MRKLLLKEHLTEIQLTKCDEILHHSTSKNAQHQSKFKFLQPWLTYKPELNLKRNSSGAVFYFRVKPRNN